MPWGNTLYGLFCEQGSGNFSSLAFQTPKLFHPQTDQRYHSVVICSCETFPCSTPLQKVVFTKDLKEIMTAQGCHKSCDLPLNIEEYWFNHLGRSIFTTSPNVSIKF